MKTKTILSLSGILICSICLMNSCKTSKAGDIASLLPPAETLNDWLLSDQINAFSDQLKASPEIVESGLSRDSYLEIVEGQVRAFQKYQDDSGRIIDPVVKTEKYFTTPCYAHSVAVLANSGYTKDQELIESGMLAMDIVTKDMARNWSEGGHGDFYTWPVMFALNLYENNADKDRYSMWINNLSVMDPEIFYATYLEFHNNWNVVNLAGEYYRSKNDLTSIDYTDSCLKGQLSHFTNYGMYREGGEPLPYDLFARHYLSGMLALGYDGNSFEKYRELAWKGAWMSMFMQSPFGELPTGYRSSHHIWNEAEQCVIFEIYASEYFKAGQEDIAGAFKRAAMLSLGSIKEWIRPDGSGYIVKNKYPIEARHGYESYSVHTCYNMLATSMLAQAWEFSNETIKEKPAPTDIGGYVLSIHDPFHKIIAAADKAYLIYDTRGDQKYNPTGILRIHIRGSHPQLGPSDGCAGLFSGDRIAIATGPSWQNSLGKWSSLAEIQPQDPLIEILDQYPGLTSFRVIYNLRDENDMLVKLTETIRLEKGVITVEDEIQGDVSQFRVNWPMLTFNGETHSDIRIERNKAIVELEGKQIQFQVINPADVSIRRSGNHYGHRNGIVEPLLADIKGNRAVYTIGIVE
ncbi:hypothetical protein ACFLTA_07325 [Bacteroidota bacterium]